MSLDAVLHLVDSSKLSEYAGHSVRLWGTLQRITEETALIKSVDEGTIEVLLCPNSELPSYPAEVWIEVIAKVNPDGATVRELRSERLPEDRPVGTLKTLSF